MSYARSRGRCCRSHRASLRSRFAQEVCSARYFKIGAPCPKPYWQGQEEERRREREKQRRSEKRKLHKKRDNREDRQRTSKERHPLTCPAPLESTPTPPATTTNIYFNMVGRSDGRMLWGCKGPMMGGSYGWMAEQSDTLVMG